MIIDDDEHQQNSKPYNNGGRLSQTQTITINNDVDIDVINHLPESSVPLLNNDTNSNIRFNYPSKWMLIKVFVIGVVLAVVAVVVFKHYGPVFMDKEVIPVINWLVNTFSRPVLAAIVFAGIALLPVLLLPTLPFKWIAGMTFGYGIGFLLIFAAVAVAVCLPYFIGYHLFYHKIKKWLDEHPREASIVRLAGDGDWFHQFRAIVLIRIAPFPYVVFNYTSVVTGVKFGPYLVGSLVGVVPDIFIDICSGILIRKLAKAVEDHTPVSKVHMIIDGTGLCIAVAATIIIGFYAKWKLEQLQDEEQQQQQQLPL